MRKNSPKKARRAFSFLAGNERRSDAGTRAAVDATNGDLLDPETRDERRTRSERRRDIHDDAMRPARD